ncbi:MAG: dTDP-4-dehydrorhamnose reductase [Undibacterium sp.]
MNETESKPRKKALILGAKGMLGQALGQEFRLSGYELALWDIAEIDLTQEAASLEKLSAFAPDFILNAVAYNRVDDCEADDDEYRKALVLNRDVPGYLARYAAEKGATLVHYSTDYVFDGTNEDGYAEDATPNPISRYGLSKYEGEQMVLSAGGTAYVIRLSKLFGEPAISTLGKKSFFDTMLVKAKNGTQVEVVDDEKSCFTYAPDLALATRELIQSGAPAGIYHLPNESPATWFQAALELYRQAGFRLEVIPVPSQGMARPAKRPHSSVLLNTKRSKLRPYEEALKDYLADML